MPDILIVKDEKNLVAKIGVTVGERSNWMKSFAIYDINSDGSKSGPYGPTSPARSSVRALVELTSSGAASSVITPSGAVSVQDQTARVRRRLSRQGAKAAALRKPANQATVWPARPHTWLQMSSA